jgi:hypothetical protein
MALRVLGSNPSDILFGGQHMGIFLRRLVGAALLDAGTYEEVEADRTATPQALAVVVLSSLAAGIGARGLTGGAATLTVFAGTSVIALLAWVAWAFVILEVGSRLLPTPDTRVDMGELLRTLGFAAGPGLIQVLGALPGAAMPVFVVAGVWTLVASFVAVRQALDYTSTGRAVAVCALGWTLSLSVAMVLGLVFGPTLSGF